MRCPACGQDVEPEALTFTWWGGVLGPKLLSHVKCPSCSARFNGKTGRSNDTAIVVYTLATTVVLLGIFYLLFWT